MAVGLHVRPQRAGHHGQHDVVDRAAQPRLDRLELGEVAVGPREAPVRADLDVVRARRRALQARAQHRAEAVGGAPELLGRSSRGARARRPRPAAASSGALARSASASAISVAALGSGRGNHGGGGSGGGAGSAAASNSTVAMSTPETPSTRQWCVFVIIAKRPPSTLVDQPDLPQRLAAVQPLGEHAPGQVAQLLEAGGLGQRGVAHVVAGVEVRVVDPHRPRLGERRERELLAVARHEVQARVELLDELVVAGRLALEQQARADVHVRAGVLEREEGGVEAGEAVGVRPSPDCRLSDPSTASNANLQQLVYSCRASWTSPTRHLRPRLRAARARASTAPRCGSSATPRRRRTWCRTSSCASGGAPGRSTPAAASSAPTCA